MGSADALHIIDLKSKNRGLDSESIEKLTKPSIVLPKDSNQLIENVERATRHPLGGLFLMEKARRLDPSVEEKPKSYPTLL